MDSTQSNKASRCVRWAIGEAAVLVALCATAYSGPEGPAARELFILALVVLAVFSASSSRLYAHTSTWRPTFFFSAGILGTFIGVSSALQGIDVVTPTSHDMGEVLTSAAIAFRTSVIGIGLAMVASLRNRLESESAQERLGERRETAAVAHLQAIESLLSESFGVQLGKQLTEQLSLFAAEERQRFENLAARYESAATASSQQLERVVATCEGVVEALQETINSANGLATVSKAAESSGHQIESALSHVRSTIGTLDSVIAALSDEAAKLVQVAGEDMELMRSAADELTGQVVELPGQVRGIVERMEKLHESAGGLSTEFGEAASGLSVVGEMQKEVLDDLAELTRGLGKPILQALSFVERWHEQAETAFLDASTVLAAAVVSQIEPRAELRQEIGALANRIEELSSKIDGLSSSGARVEGDGRTLIPTSPGGSSADQDRQQSAESTSVHEWRSAQSEPSTPPAESGDTAGWIERSPDVSAEDPEGGDDVVGPGAGWLKSPRTDGGLQPPGEAPGREHGP